MHPHPASHSLRLPVLVLAAACAAACNGTPPPAAPAGEAPTAEVTARRDDLAGMLTFGSPDRSIERFVAQARRFIERSAELGDDMFPMPPNQLLAAGRGVWRREVFQGVAGVPPRQRVELRAPARVGVSVPAEGEPGFCATVSVEPGEVPLRPFTGGSEGGEVRGIPSAGGRLALGYEGVPPVDLFTVAEAGTPDEDDLELVVWGRPAASRLKRLLLRQAAEQRAAGPMGAWDEVLVGGLSMLFDLLGEVERLKVDLRIGGPGEPAFAVRGELEPAAGGDLAAIYAAADPAGEFPFLGAAGGDAESIVVSRPSPAGPAVRRFWTDRLDRAAALAASLAPEEVQPALESARSALRRWIELTDGRSLAAGRLDLDPFAGGSQILILGVTDGEAARAALREVLGGAAALAGIVLPPAGVALEVGFETDADRVDGVPVDVLVVREPIGPGDLEIGRVPFASEWRIAVGDDRVVLAVGEDWERRIGWALRDAAEDGGVANAPLWRDLAERLPAWAVTAAGLDLGRALAVGAVGRSCPLPAAAPRPSIHVWTGSPEPGRGRFELTTGTRLAEELAELAGIIDRCIGRP